jgi:PPP family 3-phenylpropionic acid transporter
LFDHTYSLSLRNTMSLSVENTIRATYFLLFGLIGFTVPFLPVVLHQQGLSDAEITFIMFANGIGSLVGPPIVSHFADRVFSAHKLLAVLGIASGLCSPLWLYADSFTSALIIALIFYVIQNPIFITIDSYSVHFAEQSARLRTGRVGMHSLRVWGSIGFLVPTATSFLAARMSIDPIAVLIATGVFCGVAGGLCALLLPSLPPSAPKGKLPFAEALEAAKHQPLFGVLAANAIAGIALAIFYSTFPRLLQERNIDVQTIGLMFNIGVIAEIALMPFTGALVKRLGIRTLIIMSLVSIPIRFALLVASDSIFVLIVSQLLHAPLIIGLAVAIPIYLGQVAGEGYRFSLQSLNNTLSTGVARIIGPVLGTITVAMSSGSAEDALERALIVSGVLVLGALFVFSGGRRGKGVDRKN